MDAASFTSGRRSPIVPNAGLRHIVLSDAILRGTPYLRIPVPNAVKLANAIESTHTLMIVYRQQSPLIADRAALVAKAVYE